MLLEAASREAEDDHSKTGFFSPNIPVHQHVVVWSEYKKNCELCKVLWVKHALKRLLKFRSLKGESTFDLRVKSSANGWQDVPVVRLHVSGQGDPNEKNAQEYELRFLEQDHFAEYPKDYLKVRPLLLKELSSYSGSPECLSLVRSWYETCTTSQHLTCVRQRTTLPCLPTRVIDVGIEDANPSLCITEGAPGSWLALSYCWGSSSNFVLNKGSFERFKAGLPLSEFPQTIRDAITITRALKERFLWVDALCILQDSAEDWQRESGKMAEVYSKASLTIIAAADASSGVTTGIFHQRKISPCARVPWNEEDATRKDFEIVNWNNEIGDEQSRVAEIEICIRAAERPAGHILLNNGPKPKSSPWATRAWTLQEQLLSWRTLTFATSQMLWSCPCYNHGEDGKMIREDKKEDLPNMLEDENIESHIPAQRRYVKWYRVVTVYSSRNLTYNSDKIVAIASVAKRMNQLFRDEYCVGLWRKDLCAGLCWRLWEPEHKRKVVPTISDSYPSWSWISVNGGIRYDMEYIEEYAAPFNPMLHVEDFKLTYVSDNPYGQVEGAQLIVSGPCLSFRYKDQDREREEQGIQTKFPRFIERRIEADEEFQRRRRPDANPELAILLIANASYGYKGSDLLNPWFPSNNFPHVYYLLVLEPVEGCSVEVSLQAPSQCFRRVAFIHLELGNVFKSMERHNQEEDIEIAKEMRAQPWPVRMVTLV
ncbi:HET-domain-containing protein [Mollisia scopiformis]|uniref:HET-domain-containing protein n=1 Tax=Mollisia scopiformis TaxID=149040 RepID=A0A194XAL2_MOLSC|nr:HET-domain-containing protein [Mollisia scopiformis]KUJ17208.1 HET-domain-containing protein [Mollisia scopiformis]